MLWNRRYKEYAEYQKSNILGVLEWARDRKPTFNTEVLPSVLSQLDNGKELTPKQVNIVNSIITKFKIPLAYTITIPTFEEYEISFECEKEFAKSTKRARLQCEVEDIDMEKAKKVEQKQAEMRRKEEKEVIKLRIEKVLDATEQVVYFGNKLTQKFNDIEQLHKLLFDFADNIPYLLAHIFPTLDEVYWKISNRRDELEKVLAKQCV
jgi:hypothetical protein